MNKTVELSNVRRRPLIIDRLSGLGEGSGTTIYPCVYVGHKLYADVHSAKPNPYYLALIIHEQEHVKRIKTYGPTKWYLHYIFRSRFRLEEELVAYGKQFTYLKTQGLTYDLDRCARNLSSFIYLWAVSKEDALAKLRDLWAKA